MMLQKIAIDAVIVAVDHIRHLRLICEALIDVASSANIVVKVRSEDEMQMIGDLKIDHILIQT